MKKKVIGMQMNNQSRDTNEESLLSSEEQSSVLMALMRGAGENYTESQARSALEWAAESRLRGHLLELAFVGKLQINFNEDGKIVFRAHDGESPSKKRKL